MKPASTNKAFLFLSLFSSSGTLLCCALPALLVSLGMGASLMGLVTRFPSLIWISEHKTGVFVFAGIMLALNGFLLWKNRNAPCPIDPELRKACLSGRQISKGLYGVSVLVFSTGFFFGYVA